MSRALKKNVYLLNIEKKCHLENPRFGTCLLYTYSKLMAAITILLEKSVTKPPLDLGLVYWTSIATYGNSKHLSRKVSPGRSQIWDQPVVPKLPKFILAHPCKQLAVTLHNQHTDHI